MSIELKETVLTHLDPRGSKSVSLWPNKVETQQFMYNPSGNAGTQKETYVVINWR